jgi:capsular exopolysaccharide synthesis family protein
MRSRDGLATFRPSPPAPAMEPMTLPGGQMPTGTNLMKVLWRRRFTVVTIVLLTIGIGCAYLAFAQRIYTSTSRLYVEENGPRLLATGPGNDITQSDAYLFRQCQLIKAEPILRAAIDASHVEHMRMFQHQGDPMSVLDKNLTVSVGKRDEIITIEVTSPYPEEAAKLVNAVVTSYQEYQSKQTQSNAGQVLDVLQHEKTKEEQVLDAKLKEIVDFKQANGELFFLNDRGTNISTQNLAEISEQLTKSKLNATTYYILYLNENNKARARELWQEAEKQTEAFDKLFEDEKQKALKLNAVQAEYQKLQQDADRTTKMCDLLDTRIKELDVTQNGGAMNIQVLELGKTEDHPTQPNKTIILITSLVAGLALSCGVTLLRDRLDHRIRSADEVGRFLGLPVLGAIPALFEANGDSRNVGRVVQDAPASAAAEAYRMLRTGVNFGWPHQSFKSLLITSPNRSEGKSSTCSNLAIAMAKAGQKTLLIDADLRKPVQHQLFGVPNFIGLSDVVDRGVRIEQAIQQTDVEGLSLLPCGTLPGNPAEITNSQTFGRLLQRLEMQYDIILIDSPPVLVVTDARILGAQADVTILVLKAGQSTRQDAEQARDGINSVGGAVLGVVLNGIPLRQRVPLYGNNNHHENSSYSVRERSPSMPNLVLNELMASGHGANDRQGITD